MPYHAPKHICTLKRQAENITHVSKLNKFQQFFYLPSKVNTKTKHRLPSLGALLKEAKRISRMKKRYIHPLSLFREFPKYRLRKVIWEVIYMITIYTGLLLYPVHVCFVSTIDAYRANLGFAVFVIQIICLTDVFLSHMTGFYDEEKEEAVLERCAIYKRYWTTITNVLVLFSSIPFGLPLRYVEMDERTGLKLLHAANLLLMLKVFETRKFSIYLDEILILVNLNPIRAKLIDVMMIGAILTHWMACLFFIIPVYAEILFGFAVQEKCWINLVSNRENYHYYIDMLFRSVSLLVSSGHEELITLTNLDSLVMLVLLLIAEVFVKIAVVYFLDVIHLTNAATTNYEMELDKLNSYMRYKKLSLATQQRIVSYYDFKFERMYLDEKGLAAAVHETLQDITLYIRHKMIRSIHVLRYLDETIVDNITHYMKEEIYLPNDIIIKSNTHASCMYFLYSGTVCVKTPNGKEVCHISEGSYFGEIGMIKERKRTADVIALEICHVFRLDRRICKMYLFNTTSIMDELQATVETRLDETRRIEETHKRLLMERIIHMDTERYDQYEY